MKKKNEEIKMEENQVESKIENQEDNKITDSEPVNEEFKIPENEEFKIPENPMDENIDAQESIDDSGKRKKRKYTKREKQVKNSDDIDLSNISQISSISTVISEITVIFADRINPEMPVTKQEKQALNEAWNNYLLTTNFQVKPEYALILANGMIFIPRMATSQSFKIRIKSFFGRIKSRFSK